MKIIDEKGRIFGKLNVIDFIFVLLLASIIPVFYYGNKLASSKRPLERKYEKVHVEVKFTKVMPELASVIKEGDISIGQGGKQVGVLKKIISNGNSEFVALGKNDEAVVLKDPTMRDIRASFELSCVMDNGVLDYEGYAVKIGNTIGFTTSMYSVQGIVVEIKR